MIVPISVSLPNAFSPKLPPSIAKLGHDELFLIELQGTLDVQGSEGTAKDGQLIGKLNVTDMNKPTLVIGHHLLEGKVVNLPKPLAVLHKHVRDVTRNDDLESSPDHGADVGSGRDVSSGGGVSGEEVSWVVAAVVKKKMVFSKRPMPIAKPVSTASRRV